MSKFNTPAAKPVASTPMTTVAQTTTYEGGAAYVRDPRSELLLFAVTNMVGEDTFYEKAGDRDTRFRALVHEVAIIDYEWLKGFIPWLRTGANMRSASVVAAVEAVKARLDAKAVPAGRELIDAACARADEPGEVLAYWTSRYGRTIPKPVKRGVADAVARLYTERTFLKYDGASKGYRFGDVIDLTHPSPADDKPYQSDLFRYALDKRHGRANGVPESLRIVTRNAVLRSEGELKDWLDPETLRQAGMTWEDVLSAQGSKTDKAKLWEAIIPSMGAMALMRNLRNFDETGVSDAAAAQVIAKLSDPEEIARSRQFPYRMLSAYREAPSLRWGHALDKALDAACQNIPALDGKTLVLVDTSSSMTGTVSGKSKIRHVDVGALIGVALAKRGADVDLYGFAGGGWGSSTTRVVFDHKLTKGGSLLKQTQEFTRRVGEVGHGTMTVEAVKETFKPGVHKRVVIVTDGQTFSSYGGDTVGSVVPADVPVFAVNTAGYKQSMLNLADKNRYEIGGFSDKMFTMMDLLSRGRDAGWPWEQ